MEWITSADRYVFGQGTHYEIYKKLGAHLIYDEKDEEKTTVHFAVWAPHAVKVAVVGSFNNWDLNANIMTPLETSGIWETYVEGAKQWDMYKFAITTKYGEVLYKADPYAFHAETRPGTASKICDIDGFTWNDSEWIKETEKHDSETRPMSIYECHLGSWQKDFSLNEDGFYDYRTLAEKLASYVKEMGYTHVELMGILEHPYDGSWGYQVTGYYAPTSRYGSPEDFMFLVDFLHRKGIGVILDWVPAHFPKDAHGLANFDGEPLYEYADTRKGEHPDWGTKVFDYNKNEVKNFLIANALFWVEKYHIDALRVDAVASMLYLDYGRSNGNWVPNKYGGNENLEAIEFFKHINSIMSRRAPRAFLIAEESTAWPKVTYRPEDDGLGFKYKWNMGWMNDFLDYMRSDPYFRKGAHNKITFSLTYAFSERYILVLSHDEVVHLKCSMLEKMPGYEVDKHANLRAAYTFMMGHPGKKLLFMGQDFAQKTEWNEKTSLQWELLNDPLHLRMQKHVKDLLTLYKKTKELYAYDSDWRSFEWINCDDADRSIFSFVRKNPRDYKDCLIFVCNFTPIDRPDYCVGVPVEGTYKMILTSYVDINDVTKTVRKKSYKSLKEPADNRPYRVNVPLRAYESFILKLQ